MPRDDRDFDELFERLKRGAPRAAGFIDWVQRPSSRLVRIPLALLLIAGGVLSFLPVLGLWMLPLGLLILALDVPPLRGPAARTALWIEAKWTSWQQRRQNRK